MKIFVFGNPDLAYDSLPLRILPNLRKLFPQYEFATPDPNEEWDIPQELIIIDTASGIDDVTVFCDLKNFQAAPTVSMHDFDALSQLRLLAKLEKLGKIKIIGLPPMMDEKIAIEKISAILNSR